MINITKKDLEILIEVEELLHTELEKGNYDSDSKEWDTWGNYWNLVERICGTLDNNDKVINYIRGLKTNAPEEKCFDTIIEMLGGKI